MTTAQRIVISSTIFILIGVFVTSDFNKLKDKMKPSDEGKLNADGNNLDTYMMLEVNKNTFPNASGDCGCLTLDKIPL